MTRKLMISLILSALMIGCVGVNIFANESVFIWSPRLGNVSTNGIEIAYKTAEKVETYVQFMNKNVYKTSSTWDAQSETYQGNLFRIELTNLEPDTEYAYQVVVNDKPVTKVHSFFTAPLEPIEFTFLAYGDTRTHQDKHKLLADKMAVDQTSPRFTLHVGDLVSNGKDLDEWSDFSEAIEKLGASMPYYAAIGNHEYNADYYYDSLALPLDGGGQRDSEWYSFDYAGVHFLILDSNILDKYTNENVPDAVELQAEWMIKDLEANKDAKWIIAIFHHPVFSSHAESRYPRLQKEWIPIFDKYGVDLVLSGHNHIFERVLSDGRNYITSGGGGAPFDYVWEYQPRLADSVAIEDALLQYTRVRVTADKLYVDIVQTHEEANDFVTLNENFKIIDHCEIENIEPY